MYLLIHAFPESSIIVVVTDKFGVETEIKEHYRNRVTFSNFAKEVQMAMENYHITNAVVYGPGTYITKFVDYIKEEFPNCKVRSVAASHR